jgi:hypothetical protein
VDVPPSKWRPCLGAALKEGILNIMLVSKTITLSTVSLAFGLAAAVARGGLAVGQVVEMPAAIEKLDQPPMAGQKPTNPMTARKPLDAAPENKRVLTPDEATRMAEDSDLTVEFKVQFVAKANLIKSDDKKDAGWVSGHGPADICLRPQNPADRKKARFSAILTEKTIKQFNRAGVQDIENHFKGKTVRVTGRIRRIHYDGYGTPTEVEVVIDDLSRIEVVN